MLAELDSLKQHAAHKEAAQQLAQAACQSDSQLVQLLVSKSLSVEVSVHQVSSCQLLWACYQCALYVSNIKLVMYCQSYRQARVYFMMVCPAENAQSMLVVLVMHKHHLCLILYPLFKASHTIT